MFSIRSSINVSIYKYIFIDIYFCLLFLRMKSANRLGILHFISLFNLYLSAKTHTGIVITEFTIWSVCEWNFHLYLTPFKFNWDLLFNYHLSSSNANFRCVGCGFYMVYFSSWLIFRAGHKRLRTVNTSSFFSFFFFSILASMYFLPTDGWKSRTSDNCKHTHLNFRADTRINRTDQDFMFPFISLLVLINKS